MSTGGGPELPPRSFLEAQSNALAGMRSRLLRRARIAHRASVLDLGAGFGVLTEELRRRCRGSVTALDRSARALADVPEPKVVAEATALPFGAGHFDLVVAQFFFLWNPDLAPLLLEVRRVLEPGGTLLTIEPDYGGAIEHPPEIAIAPIARTALERAGADPCVGRQLGPALRRLGFQTEILLSSGVAPESELRFEALDGLPLVSHERQALDRARAAHRKLGPDRQTVHVPTFFTLATVPGAA